MRKHLAVVIVSLLSAWTTTGDALAERARNGGGPRTGFHGAAKSNAIVGQDARERSFHHGHFHYRSSSRRAFYYGFERGRVLNEGYTGDENNCVLEGRYVWNGWGTMRELITVCY